MISTLIRVKYEELSLISNVVDTIILYGVSGSGKSYTCNEIVKSLPSRGFFKVTEIYTNKPQLLFEEKVCQDIQKEFEKIQKDKHVSGTISNDKSSRSILIYESDTMTIIDLMGSEKPIDAIGILSNKTLLSIGRILRQMKEGISPSFRDDKSCMELKKYLTGQVLFIGCITTHDDTITQEFLSMIKDIKLPNYQKKVLKLENIDICDFEEALKICDDLIDLIG